MIEAVTLVLKFLIILKFFLFLNVEKKSVLKIIYLHKSGKCYLNVYQSLVTSQILISTVLPYGVVTLPLRVPLVYPVTETESGTF